ARGRLFGLAGDRKVRPGREELTLREVAELTGTDVGLVTRLWQAFGLPIVDPDTKVASRDDASTVPLFASMAQTLGEEAALGLARVGAASVAKFSDAVSAALRSVVKDLAIDTSGSELATAQTYSRIADLTPAVGRALDVLLRHHLEAARRQFELSGSNELALLGQIRMAVGFADMTGFTAMSQAATSAELARTLDAFEVVATNAVHGAGGRVVKFIGDAVMFVHPAPDAAVGIAQRMVAECTHPVRAGMSYGVLLAQDGDYFGPPVNLAARLTDAAAAGQVLVSDDLRERLGDTRRTEAQPPRVLRGIADPVVAYAVL
ncbi:MAG TPA: adenylate cyclase regulatory domain-containing protein, partial [Candidatus Limnocylindrales bacterium]